MTNASSTRLQSTEFTACWYSRVRRAPGEARARSPHIFNAFTSTLLHFNFYDFRPPEGLCFVWVKVVAPGLRIEKPDAFPSSQRGCRVTSGRAPAAGFLHSLPHSGLIPVRPNFCAWECKLTPAGCACQEGNTTGCIPSNDGLGDRLKAGFPQRQGCGVSPLQSDPMAQLVMTLAPVSSVDASLGLEAERASSATNVETLNL